MEHKKAADILIKMVEEGRFSEEEKEAVLAAVGVLAWTQLAQSRIKNLKKNKNKGENL